MKKEYMVWMTDIDTILKVYDLAKSRGKKAGDNIQQEFFEVMEQSDSHIGLIGKTDKNNIKTIVDKIRKKLDENK